MKNGNMPKTIQKWINDNPDKVESAHVEHDEFDGPKNPFSVWCYLKPGLSYEGEAHHIHEPSVKDFMEATKRIVSCECSECLELQGKN